MQSKSLSLLVALVLVASLGIYVLERDGSDGPQPLFEGFDLDTINSVNKISIVNNPDEPLTVEKTDRGWLLVEEDYPADTSMARNILFAISEAKRLSFKTDREEQFAQLGVMVPNSTSTEGAGTRLEIATEDGRDWQIIAGNYAQAEYRNGQYVRLLSDNTAWLLNRYIGPEPTLKRWIDHNVININPATIHRIVIKQPEKPTIDIVRPARGTNLELQNVPAGREQKTSDLSRLLTVGQDFTAEEVLKKPADYKPRWRRITATVTTFDGLEVVFNLYSLKEVYYASLEASENKQLMGQFSESAPGAHAKVAEQVARLSSKFSKHYYQISSNIYDKVVSSMMHLTKEEPKEESKKEG